MAVTFLTVQLWMKYRKTFLKDLFLTGFIFSVFGIVIGAIALIPNIELFFLNTRSRFVNIDWWLLAWKRPIVGLLGQATLINPNIFGTPKTFDLMHIFGNVGLDLHYRIIMI